MFFQERPIDDPKDFYNRELELERLKKSMFERAITLVVGIRRTGKTSLIRVATKDIVNIYIDARRFEERSYIIYRDFLEEFRKGLNLLIPKYRKILKYLKLISGINIIGVKIEFSWNKERPSFSSILDCLNEWAGEENIRLVIIFDEAQEFIKMKGFNLTPVISYAYDNLENISFIFAGSKIGMLYNFLRIDDPSSPLYGRYMEKIVLNPLTREQSIDFLEKGFREVGVKIDKRILNMAVDKLDGIIGWLSYFGLTAMREGLTDKTIEKVLEKASKLALQELYNFIRLKGSKRYIEIMRAVKNEATWSEIKRYLELKTGEKIYSSALSRLLKNLINAGFIEQRDKKYFIPDPVLRYAI